MSFITNPVNINEAKKIIKKYNIVCPYPGDDIIEYNLTSTAYDKTVNALIFPIRWQNSFVSNGVRVMDGFDAINILIWRGCKVRIDSYKNIIGDFDEVVIIAKNIIAPLELKDYKDEMLKIIEKGMITLYKSGLQQAEKDRVVNFKPISVKFINEDDIWN
jgi:hypothetical protein